MPNICHTVQVHLMSVNKVITYFTNLRKYAMHQVLSAALEINLADIFLNMFIRVWIFYTQIKTKCAYILKVKSPNALNTPI